MAIDTYIRGILNGRMGDVAFKAQLGNQIYALQQGLTEGETDPFSDLQVPLGMGFSSGSVYGFGTAQASGSVVTAGTAVATNAVAWARMPRQWSVAGPVGASVSAPTFSSGQVTFDVNASATGTVTVTFS